MLWRDCLLRFRAPGNRGVCSTCMYIKQLLAEVWWAETSYYQMQCVKHTTSAAVTSLFKVYYPLLLPKQDVLNVYTTVDDIVLIQRSFTIS